MENLITVDLRSGSGWDFNVKNGLPRFPAKLQVLWKNVELQSFRSITLQCENCLKCGKETFHKAFELKKTGLKIFNYKCWESTESKCRGSQPLAKKEYIILDNPSDNELRRPDFIKELCQYKTKCLCCRILIKRVLRLLDEIDEIKKHEVIGVCEHCKQSSKVTCKKCEYLINKYIAERRALDDENLFRQWLKELEHILEPLSGEEYESAGIAGPSAARAGSRARQWLAKNIPKEFRYPPTTREFFPDYGSPFVTRYPQSREPSMGAIRGSITDDKISHEIASPKDRRVLQDDMLEDQTPVENKGPHYPKQLGHKSLQQAAQGKNRGLLSKIPKSLAQKQQRNLPKSDFKVPITRQKSPNDKVNLRTLIGKLHKIEPSTEQVYQIQKDNFESITATKRIKEKKIGDGEFKSIMAKGRIKFAEPSKTVVVKLQKEKVIKNRKPRNLHILDMKLEKLIYNTFIKRMKIMKDEKEKKQRQRREKRMQENSTVFEQGPKTKKTTGTKIKIKTKTKTKIDVLTKLFDSEVSLEEEEEDIIFFRSPSIDQMIESDPHLAPVVCSGEKKPNVKIVGDRIVRLKSNKVPSAIFKPASLQTKQSKVKFNPPFFYGENPVFEADTPVLNDAEILEYELSNPTWITNGWTVLPKQVTVKEVCLYDMEPVERNWFLLHKNQELFYTTGERLAIIDEEGNGRVFYKNGKEAMIYTCNKDNPERMVVYSSGEGSCKLSANRPIRKLAVFDHLGSGVVFDAVGRPRLKYNQSEGQKLDNDIKGVPNWKFHSLNPKAILKTEYEETVENVRSDSFTSSESNIKKDKEEDIPMLSEDKTAMVAIERSNRQKLLETNTYELFTCELGPIRINKHFDLHIFNQRNIKLRFRDAAGVVVNLGMRMLSTSLIGFLLSKETEVVTPLDDKVKLEIF